MSRTAFLACLTAGLAARLALTLTSVGTNDVMFFTAFLALIRRYGIAHAYAQTAMLNHPPLSLLILSALGTIADRLQVEATDLLRLMQSGADLLTTLLLAASARSAGVPRSRTLALLFFLSPAAIFVSGFHGNTDSTMLLLVIAALVLHARAHHPAAGLALALATGIKIVPLLIVPLFVVSRGGRAFLAAFAVAFAALFAPAIVAGGPPVAQGIFGYASLPEWWGIAAMLQAGSMPEAGAAYVSAARVIELLAVGAVTVMYARGERDLRRLAGAVATVLLALLVFAPGLGVQYLIWPLPLLPFALGFRAAAAVSASSSLFMLAMYSSWSRGFPWSYANSLAHPWPHATALYAGGYILWFILLAALVAATIRLGHGQRSSALQVSGGAAEAGP